MVGGRRYLESRRVVGRVGGVVPEDVGDATGCVGLDARALKYAQNEGREIEKRKRKDRERGKENRPVIRTKEREHLTSAHASWTHSLWKRIDRWISSVR